MVAVLGAPIIREDRIGSVVAAGGDALNLGTAIETLL